MTVPIARIIDPTHNMNETRDPTLITRYKSTVSNFDRYLMVTQNPGCVQCMIVYSVTRYVCCTPVPVHAFGMHPSTSTQPVHAFGVHWRAQYTPSFGVYSDPVHAQCMPSACTGISIQSSTRLRRVLQYSVQGLRP